MTFSRNQKKVIRNQVKLGIMDAWKDQKKDIIRMCMTREECLSLHQGRTTPPQHNGGNGGLRKQKIKFWSLVIGLIIALVTLGGIVLKIIEAAIRSA